MNFRAVVTESAVNLAGSARTPLMKRWKLCSSGIDQDVTHCSNLVVLVFAEDKALADLRAK